MLCFEPTVKVATKESRQSHDKKSRDGEVATKKIAKKKEGVKKKKSPKKGKESENFGWHLRDSVAHPMARMTRK